VPFNNNRGGITGRDLERGEKRRKERREEEKKREEKRCLESR